MSIIKFRNFNAIRAKMYGKPLTPTDRLILLRSYPHTHTELQFSARLYNISFSSTTADGANGCRFKQIEYSHPEYWDTVEVEVTDMQEECIYREAQTWVSEGIKYDGLGLLSFSTGLNIIRGRDNMAWCTEACLGVAQVAIEMPKLLIPDKSHPAMCDMVLRHWVATGQEILPREADKAVEVGK